MKTTALLLTILLCTFFTARSQAPACGSDIILNRALQDSAVRMQHNQLELQLYQQQQNGGAAMRRAGPYVLPVVVHVIHDNGTENISNTQVLDAIDHINDAFANVGYYDSLTGVNTNIQFCLAKQTPQGTATNGIVRVQSTLTNLDMNDDVQMKNLSRWNPLCYTNIWIVKEICSQSSGCGVAGYAYFPSAHGGSVDGLVVEARYFGTSPGNSGVAVHELGHYLGLYHTFQGGCTNSNCLNDGDKVCDTPPDGSTAAIACSGSTNTCNTDAQSGFTSDQNDNHTNYMDYGYPACMNMFTQGQTDRMHWHIDNVRYSLLNCISCNDPCTTNIVAQFAPSATTTTVGTSVTFTNQSTNAATYTWYLNGTQFSTAASPNYTFNTQGTYIIRLQAVGSDVNCVDYYTDTVVVNCGVVASFTQSTTQVNPGDQVTFTNTSTGGTSFSWYVDGVMVSASSTTYAHTFNTNGTFPVYLIATGGLCSDTTSIVNFVHVGAPCAISFTHEPQQLTTCLGVTYMPDTTCNFSSYNWSFCQDSFVLFTTGSYPVPGPFPDGGKLIKDRNGNYHYFYMNYTANVPTANTIHRLYFGNSLNNAPVKLDILTPSLTATYGHGIDIVEDGGNYYGFAVYDNLIYRFDFGTDISNSTPTVTQVTGFPANAFYFAHKIELVRETNTWWILVVARNSGTFNVLYLGNDIKGSVQADYSHTCTDCWGFSYQKVNGKHYIYVTSIFQGMRLMSFGNSLANNPSVGAWARVGPRYHGDVSLYENCDGTFFGVVMMENDTSHIMIYLDSITATPQYWGVFFGPRSNSITRLVRTDAGYTAFATQAYASQILQFNFLSDCGINYSTEKFPPPVYYPQPGTYYVRLSVDEGLPTQQTYCSSVTVTTPTQAVLDLGHDTTVCDNGVFPLDAGAGFASYKWDDNSTDRTRTVFSAGTYWVEATDSCNTTYRDSITIVVDSATAIVLGDATICEGNSVVLSAPPGFATYTWTPATALSCTTCSTTTATPTDTTAYTVTATTVNGCVNSASAIISVNECDTASPLTAVLSSVSVSCLGMSDGSVHVDVTGGVPPYDYLWSTGDTTDTVDGLASGQYTVTVNDAAGTAIISNVFVNSPAQLIILTASYTDHVTCYGDSNGGIKVLCSGGTQPYSYLWNNGHNGDSPANLAAGTYTVTATDANGCTATTSITIDEGPQLQLVGNIVGADTVNINLPTLFYVNAGYSYTWWSHGAVVSGQGTNNIVLDWNAEGFDTVAVMVSLFGCKDTLYKPVVLLNLPTGINDVLLQDIALYPNPTNASITLKAPAATADAELLLFDALGKRIFEQNADAALLQSGVELDLSLLSEGIYFLNIRSGGEVKVMKVVRY